MPLLQRLVYAATGVPPILQKYGRADSGQPLLLHPEGWHISVSHSGGREAAVVSPRLVGVDIERVRPVCRALARRIFTPDERLQIELSANPALAYTRLWTMRESHAKCTGAGLRGVLALAGKPLPAGYAWRSEEKNGYIVTVCMG
jgi:4'-phosphopantetheinyl transferase